MYASSVAFVRRVDHSSVILSCNLIGQRENKSFYVTEIVLRLGYADVIFRPRESRQPEIRLRSQATKMLTKLFSFSNSGIEVRADGWDQVKLPNLEVRRSSRLRYILQSRRISPLERN